tara:strand:- start:611 stop:1045 length:435 start_codon:yes stop_codon:yes gene_type:complete
VAVVFVNNWKNIADKLQNKLRGEFGNSMSIYIGEGEYSGNQFLKILPVSNEILERYIHAELRQYNFQLIYYFMDANIKKGALTQMFRVLSRIESLVAQNRTLTLADSTDSLNGRITDYEITEGEDGFEYLVEMNFTCLHLGNIS